MVEKFDISILLIEDDDKIRSSLFRTIALKTEKVFEAENPRAALEILKENKIDLIVTDIEMPEMDGLTFIEKLRKSNFQTPVIITSAYTSPDYFKKAIDLKIDKYITKPVKIVELFDAIEVSYNKIKSHKLEKKNTELENRVFEYQSRMSSIGEMVGNISHQWRQPLATISTVVTELKFMKELDNLSDELFNEDISIIEKNILQMSQTMDDFRELIIGDKEPKDFNLNEHISNILNITKAVVVTNFIKLSYNFDEQIRITNLKNALTQAMINIINNAKDALLSIPENDRYLIINLNKDENFALITIQDTAGGIKIDDINRVFEILFTTKNDTGTGLGLYMTKNLINEKMGGEISVENNTFTHNENTYTGAKFTIKLPL